MEMILKYQFRGYFFLLLLLVIIGCHKNNDTQPSNNISHNDSTALVEIFRDISKDNHTILDIPPIPVPDKFLNSEDEYIKQAVASMEMFNDLITNPQDTDQSFFKSSKSVNYTKNCETHGMYTECTFKEDHGAYKITVIQNIGPYGQVLEVYYSGIYEGTDYGEMYEVQQYVFSPDGKSFYLFLFREPIPPESSGEYLMTFSIQVKDGKTIYTPWGEEHKNHIEYTNFIYAWDNVKKENHQSLGSWEEWDGDILKTYLFAWSISKEETYMSYASTWNFNTLEGEWCSYDDDEHVIDCGSL